MACLNIKQTISLRNASKVWRNQAQKEKKLKKAYETLN
jgi:hypothetical protein